MKRSISICVVLLASCDPPASLPANAAAAVEAYADVVSGSYADALAGAESLSAAVDAFVAAPTPRASRPRSRRGATRASPTSKPRPTASTAARSRTSKAS